MLKGTPKPSITFDLECVDSTQPEFAENTSSSKIQFTCPKSSKMSESPSIDYFLQLRSSIPDSGARGWQDGASFNCPPCSKRLLRNFHRKMFKNRMRLNQHTTIVLKKKKLTCATCKQPYKTKRTLDNHVCRRIKDGVCWKPFMCDSCGKSYSSIQTLKYHIRSAHSAGRIRKSFTCNHCSKMFKWKQNLITHIEKKHAHSRSQCAICQDNEHSKSMKKPSYMCDKCPKKFRSERTMKLHTESDHPPQCAVCGESFDRDHNLKKHIEWVHLKIFACEVCTQAFMNEAKLDKHYLTVHRDVL